MNDTFLTQAAINLINKSLVISEIENFSISVKSLYKGDDFQADIKKPLSKLIGSIICCIFNNKIKLYDPYNVYSHWICGFIKEFGEVTNQLDKGIELERVHLSKEILLPRVLSVLKDYLFDKDTLMVLWNVFTNREIKNNSIVHKDTVTKMKNLSLSNKEIKIVLDNAMRILESIVNFDYENFKKVLSSVFGKEIFIEHYAGSVNIYKCIRSKIRNWK